MMTAVNHRLDEALAYASAGIKIFPCHSMRGNGECSCGCALPQCRNRGKHPRITAWQDAASTDGATIRGWWRQWPDANIGAAMQKSRRVALDIDPRNGGDETWAQLVTEGGPALEDTWTNLTGGGGVHYIFAVPDAFVCRTDALGPGVDVKWHGYVLLPPSDHYAGTMYAWEIGASPFDRPAALLPAFVADKIEARDRDERERERTPIAELLASYCPDGEGHSRLLRILGSLRTRVSEDEAHAIITSWNLTHCQPKPIPQDVIDYQVHDIYQRYPDGAPVEIGDDFDETAGEAGEPRWKLIRGSDLRRMELPPIVWALENTIPRGRYVVLSGESGLGKSWWALLFCLAAGTGRDFLGRKTALVKALYIDEENGIQEAQRRLRALADGLGIPEDAELPVDFYIDESIKLGKPTDARELAAIVQAEEYTTVITDSLIRFFDGNENNSDEVAKFHAGVDYIRKATGVDWVMLQHLNKAGANGGLVSAGDRIRGSGEFKAHADVHIQLRGVDGTGNVITHVEKLRGGVRPADVVYRLDGNTMLDEPVTMTVIGSTAAAIGAENAALMYACELLENAGPLTVGELLKFLKERYGVASRTAENAIAKARKQGVIVVDRKEKNSVFLRLGRGADVD